MNEQTASIADFFRLLFEQAGAAMVAVDLNGSIVAWNHASVRMFGAGAAEMIGTDWTHLIPADAREQVTEVLERALHTGALQEFEFSLRNPKGDPRRLAVIVTPLATHDGTRVGAIMCVRDITNRVVLQDRLSQQMKMAALGELAGAFSHQFNNILGGMVTSIDFALASGDYAIMQSVMEKSQTALARAGHLVERLLTFAEGDFRDAGLCDLGELVCHHVDRLEARLAGTNITVNARIEAIRTIEVPATQTGILLQNLIDNAIEAMPDGGTIAIELVPEDAWAVLRVADTGVGMPDKARQRIFEPFFSTKRSGETDKSSRGLGLAVVHGIVKVLGGSIEVRSRPGGGTVFEVRLPLGHSVGTDDNTVARSPAKNANAS